MCVVKAKVGTLGFCFKFSLDCLWVSSLFEQRREEEEEEEEEEEGHAFSAGGVQPLLLRRLGRRALARPDILYAKRIAIFYIVY